MRKCAMLFVFSSAIGIGTFHLQAQSGTPGSLIQAPRPLLYPTAAKAAGIEGKVVLKGVIDADGHMKNLEVIKGPPELRQAAMDAVMSWTYHPYTDHGKVVLVPTTVNVIFTLGSKKQKAKAIAAAKADLAKAAGDTSDPNAASTVPKDQ